MRINLRKKDLEIDLWAPRLRIVKTAQLLFLGLFLIVYAVNLFAEEIDVTKKIKELKHKDAKVRMQVVDVLGKYKEKKAIPEIIKMLKSEKNDMVKVHIVHSLGLIGGKDVVYELIEVAKMDKSKDVRVAACLSLGVLKDKTVVDTLKEILLDENEDDNVRVSAGSSLTHYIDEPGVKEALENVLRSKNRVVKFGIVNSLRHIKRKDVGKSLLKIAAEDTDEEIKKLAEELLKKEQ